MSDQSSTGHLLRRSQIIEWLVFNTIGLSLITLTSFLPAKVTAGWYDQTIYHWKTIAKLADQLPNPDLVNISTATGPLYHLYAAIYVRLGHLTMAQAQFAVGLTTWIALVSTTLYALRNAPVSWRWLGTTATVVSTYVLESTLWMLTDAFSLVFSILSIALILELRRGTGAGVIMLLGVSNLCATSTRQTAVWLLLATIVGVIAWVQPNKRFAAIMFTCVPAGAVLIWLYVLWGGATPPLTQTGNAAKPSQVGVSVGFALWTFYVGPIVLFIRFSFREFWESFIHSSKWTTVAILGGSFAALPAVVWRSNYDFPARGGGWLWKLIEFSGAIRDRSPLLVVLAFMGGVFLVLIGYWLVFQKQDAEAWLIVLSVVSALAVSAVGSNAMPKYREIPLMACLVLTLALLAETRFVATRHAWLPVAIPAMIQITASALIVGLPILQWLASPGSVPAPEWVDTKAK